MVTVMNEQMTDFERKARDVFDASVEALDANTRSRLNQARQAALAAGAAAPPPAWRAWAPAGAVAAALVAAILWRVPGTGVSPPAPARGSATRQYCGSSTFQWLPQGSCPGEWMGDDGPEAIFPTPAGQ